MEILTSSHVIPTRLSFLLPVFTISQVFSPLLPVALIAGQVLASVRLKNKGIFCINPARIAIAGKIRVFCFDKTGTITKDSLDFLGARHVDRAGKIIMMSGLWHPRDSVPDIDLLRAMASCHAVSLLGDTLVGNEVEVKMFEATGWNLVSRPNDTPLLTSPDGSDRLRVVRRFEFDHERQAMTVVVRDASGAAFVFVKGSFEKIEDISKPNTVPDDYKATAKNMALEGCYVLAVAMKALGRPAAADIDNLDRDEFERDMELLGMVAFRNELKVSPSLSRHGMICRAPPV